MNETFDKVILVIFLAILTIFAGIIIWVTVGPVVEVKRSITGLQTSASQIMTDFNTRITALESNKRR